MTEVVLHSFTGGADGNQPAAGVIRDAAGNLYGTTYYGGATGWGVVYRINTSHRLKVLYTFTGGTDGGRPNAGVVRDSRGNLMAPPSSGGTRPPVSSAAE